MRESRPYGSVRGARDETRVPTATCSDETARVHIAARRRSGLDGGGARAGGVRKLAGRLPPGLIALHAILSFLLARALISAEANKGVVG